MLFPDGGESAKHGEQIQPVLRAKNYE